MLMTSYFNKNYIYDENDLIFPPMNIYSQKLINVELRAGTTKICYLKLLRLIKNDLVFFPLGVQNQLGDFVFVIFM